MKLFRICLPAIVLLSFVLGGCPVGSKFPLGTKADALLFDKSLVGTWENNDGESEATLVKVEKTGEANLYKLSVLTKGEAFMADSEHFHLWVTQLEGKKFLVLQEIKDADDDVFYVYAFSINGSQLTTNDIALKVKGTDAITSVKAYREEVAASMKHPEFISGTLQWKRK